MYHTLLLVIALCAFSHYTGRLAERRARRLLERGE